MGCDENRMSINLAAAVFVAVSILKALKTEDLSRKLEVNYVKFQFRGGLLGLKDLSRAETYSVILRSYDIDQFVDVCNEVRNKINQSERFKTELSKKHKQGDQFSKSWNNYKVWKEQKDSIISQLNRKTLQINYLKAQLQDKTLAITEMCERINELKGKFVDTKLEKSSVVRQPNAFKFQKPPVMGKPTPFVDSLEKQDFLKPRSRSVPKTNVKQDLSKPVTPQILLEKEKGNQVEKNTNVLAPGMFKLDTKPTQTRTPQLHQDYRRTNQRVSGPPNNSDVNNRLMHVEEHRRIFKFSNNTKSETACNDILNASTSNVNFVYETCGKYVLNENHDACVLSYIYDVNAITKKNLAVPISASKPKRTVNQSVATPYKKTITSDSTIQKPRSRFKMLYENES
ncbi:hypothetical protein Tco_0946515 [Tanacetum coccineum]